jgi:tRNA dimethylallyltransferase
MSKLYLILGCTAGGKGALGRELARRLEAEIVSVDSMKIYRGMDIGTAKPSASLRAEIAHWCIDVVDPWEAFSVAQYVEAADAAISDIRSRRRLALAVGGTSLYIKALIEGLFEGPGADPDLRQQLGDRAQVEGLHALHDELSDVDPEAARRIHPNDAKRIIRALEVYRITGKPISHLQSQWDSQQRRYDCILIGLRRALSDQNRRINARVKKMVDAGLVEEVRSLAATAPGIRGPAAQAVGYAEILEHFEGKVSLEKAIENIKINTRRLAKKQRTWQRRFRDVRWFDVEADASATKLADRVLDQVAVG